MSRAQTAKSCRRAVPKNRVTTSIFAAAVLAAPTLAGGTDPPVVTVTFPNGGEVIESGSVPAIQWTAVDENEVLGVDVLVSFDNGVNWSPLARDFFNSGILTWYVQNRPTTQAKVRVIAYDFEQNVGIDESNAVFTIVSAPGGRLPTTLRDFDMAGTQPVHIRQLPDPTICGNCHGFYNSAVEPYYNWKGSMMAYASVDPLFRAALHITNQDARDSGDNCIRCHAPAGWYGGRSQPTDATQLTLLDQMGVTCATCHSIVDPFYEAGVSPMQDVDILAGLQQVPTTFSNGQLVLETEQFRFRGPFVDAVAGHQFLPSPFHRDAALCGSCHDVSNPLLDRHPNGTQTLNAHDTPAANMSPTTAGVEQRTYSEWFFSAFNSVQGVYNPDFAGNRPDGRVATCQDCHMRDVLGKGCFFEIAPERPDLPLHDLSGGSTWLLSLVPIFAPNYPDLDPDAIADGVLRARYMLQHAAELSLSRISGGAIRVKVTNKSGHKLPTGYTEGRRIWLNVKYYDSNNAQTGESGAYDPATGVLTLDPAIKVYEARLVAGADVAAAASLPPNTEFHLSLNSVVVKDNRIPPEGFSNSAYQAFGGAPVGATFPDGQNWDITLYSPPPGAVRATVTLYYQSISKAYIEFLRDEGGVSGQFAYDLWNNNGKSPPEVMETASIFLIPGDLNCDGLVNNFDIDAFVLAITDPVQYALSYPTCDLSLADLNADGLVNNFDIDPFVMCVVNGGCP